MNTPNNRLSFNFNQPATSKLQSHQAHGVASAFTPWLWTWFPGNSSLWSTAYFLRDHATYWKLAVWWWRIQWDGPMVWDHVSAWQYRASWSGSSFVFLWDNMFKIIIFFIFLNLLIYLCQKKKLFYCIFQKKHLKKQLVFHSYTLPSQRFEMEYWQWERN